MNVTFLIGNGFDINLGLRTKYTDFIEIYREIQPQDNEIIKRFKRDIIERNRSRWSDAELAFGEATSSISENFTVEDFCNCHTHFCTALAEYLRCEQKRLILNKENTQIIATNFSKAVNNFTLGFRPAQSDQIRALISSYSSSISFNFLDFNYTNVLELLCRYTNSVGWGTHNNFKNTMGSLIHVHGTVDKSMVLGVHDESQLANAESFKFYDQYYIAQMIKSRTDFFNEENTYKNALQILNNSHLIYIYGMSLGDTDKYWWENICRLLRGNSSLRVILHCYNAPKNELLPFEIRRFEDKQRDRLLSFGNDEKEQTASLRERIHVTGENIFSDLENIAVPLSENQAKAG